jgi:hypothetical protein
MHTHPCSCCRLGARVRRWAAACSLLAGLLAAQGCSAPRSAYTPYLRDTPEQALANYRLDLLSHNMDRVAEWYAPPENLQFRAFGELSRAHRRLARAATERWGSSFCESNELPMTVINMLESVTRYDYSNVVVRANKARADAVIQLAGIPPQHFTQRLERINGHWYIRHEDTVYPSRSDERHRLAATARRTEKQRLVIVAMTEAIQRRRVGPDQLISTLNMAGMAYIQDIQAIQDRHSAIWKTANP